MDLNNMKVKNLQNKSRENNPKPNKTSTKNQKNTPENENEQNSITLNNTNNFNDINKENQEEEYEIYFARNDKIFYTEHNGFNINDDCDENFYDENCLENNDYNDDKNEYYGENDEKCENYDEENKYHGENKDKQYDFYDEYYYEYYDGYEEKNEYYKTEENLKENLIEGDDIKNKCVSKKEIAPKYESVKKEDYEIRRMGNERIKREQNIRYTYNQINARVQNLYEDYKWRYEAINEELTETIKMLTKEMEILTCNYFKELKNLQKISECACAKKFCARRRQIMRREFLNTYDDQRVRDFQNKKHAHNENFLENENDCWFIKLHTYAPPKNETNRDITKTNEQQPNTNEDIFERNPNIAENTTGDTNTSGDYYEISEVCETCAVDKKPTIEEDRD